MSTPQFRLVRRPTDGGAPPGGPAAAAPAPRPAADAAQQRVVDHGAGALLVLGAPGTGKTRVLVEAVAARVATGVDPERILVLTFGRRAAGALRHRIEARVTGAADAVHEPLVRTFHAYAFGLLCRAAGAAGEPAPRLLSGPEQDLVIRELLEPGDGVPTVPWPAGLAAALGTRAFAGQLRDLLLRTAERGIDAAELARLGRDLGRPDWVSAADFVDQYVEVLALREATTRGAPAYDHAELIRAAADLLRADPELLAAERRRLAYVYVDEYAETDPAQRELLALVAGGGAPVVAFADPDSAIYGFRGADPAGVRDFGDRFAGPGSPAATAVLDTVHRCGGELWAASRRVAARLRGPGPHRHPTPADPAATPVGPAGGAVGVPGGPAAGQPGAEGRPPVEVATFRTATSEAAYAAHVLREAHLRDGVPWSRMAVLVRSARGQLPAIQRALHVAGVPTSTQVEESPLHRQPAVAPLLRVLRCAVDPAALDEDAAVALLHSPLGGADPLAERRLRQGLRALALAAGDDRSTGDLLVEALRDPTELAAVERRWAEPARAVADALAAARRAHEAPGSTVEDVLWALWQRTGLAERWAALATRPPREGEAGHVQRRRAAAADQDLDAVVALFALAARFVDRLPGARTEVFLDHVLGQQVAADSLAPTAVREETVALLSAHAAKGLEWDVVVVAGVQEGVWPDLRLRGSLLGAERLVDLVAGRAGTGGAAAAAGQVSALLDDERRLFHVAVSRARRRLVATAVASGAVGGADGEEQPSRFLHELGAGAAGAGEAVPALPVRRLPRALTLPALVAELRAAVADPAAPEPRRRAAADQLAQLAAAGVPGAHPDQWWGLPALSDAGPLYAEDDAVRVTPSTMESVLRCSLRWLLERHGGAAAASAAQGVGNLVHNAAMLAEDAQADRAALLGYVASRFDAIELAARWLAGRERRRAEVMVDKLLGWLAGNPRRLLAIEREFAVRLDDATPVVELTGRVDRLEVDAQGRLVVVDLKTGRTTSVTAPELAAHPQLGAYQVAVEEGAFAEYGQESGGAALVQLGTPAATAREQAQPPVAETEDPSWAREMVARTARTMAASTFAAVANARCQTCPVRVCCPVSGKGRQVVAPPGGAAGAGGGADG
ncbi:DNA helicase [Pilimelia terevasa]|uniref:DNA 3'-5' helicase n=1 Tax=Pilimelia terevasa TaxID=53372 RepID=A0A8J3BKC9_9ACTN|nr:ATP-dependent DNA helicase [Pilimelia terevasa]GGK16959.1 DNA helicase [Pilimelia terevasa]